MAESLLEQLRKMTVVVADTGDFQSIREFTPQDATTNPSLIAAAAQMPEYQPLVDETLKQARATAGLDATSSEVVALAFEQLAIAFGLRILEIVPGRVSTEADPRLSWDTDATIAQARSLITRYEAAGVDRSRILIKIASTWEGIRAGEQLEREGIHCNLTLLFGLHQAAACAEAGVTLISPFVGRILDWHKKTHGRDYAPSEDPGVHSVTRIFNYFKKFGFKTEVMGASFRNAGEILELAGCDLLTISPALLKQLEEATGPLTRKLDPLTAANSDIEKLTIDQATFEQMHAADPMASEKLAEGIEGFTQALEKTEALLAERLQRVEAGEALEDMAGRLFGFCDPNGDGFIDREEWPGTDAVFDAMDRDHDGRISLGELRTGLGGLLHIPPQG